MESINLYPGGCNNENGVQADFGTLLPNQFFPSLENSLLTPVQIGTETIPSIDIKIWDGRSLVLEEDKNKFLYIKGVTYYSWDRSDRIGDLNSYISPSRPNQNVNETSQTPKYAFFDQDLERLELGVISPDKVRIYGALDRDEGIQAFLNSCMQLACFKEETKLDERALSRLIPMPVGVTYNSKFDEAFLDQIMAGFSVEQLSQKNISGYSAQDILKNKKFAALSLTVPTLNVRCDRVRLNENKDQSFDVGYNIGKSMMQSVLRAGLILKSSALHAQNFIFVPVSSQKHVLSSLMDYDDLISLVDLKESDAQEIIFYALAHMLRYLDSNLEIYTGKNKEYIQACSSLYKIGFLTGVFNSGSLLSENSVGNTFKHLNMIGDVLSQYPTQAMDLTELSQLGMVAKLAKSFRITDIMKKTYKQRNKALSGLGLLKKVTSQEAKSCQEYLRLVRQDRYWPKQIYDNV